MNDLESHTKQVINDYRIFDEYKNKIINALDFQDAESLVNISQAIMSDDIEKKLIQSVLNKERYNNNIEFDRFVIYLNIIDKIKYNNDAYVIIQDLELIYDDNAQINTLNRIISKKPCSKPLNNKQYYLQVCCPHCKKKNTGINTTEYIICGYSTKGYDWKGCGKDWCFKCGKKLCKNWNFDHLFNKLNRTHDDKCCKTYAAKIGDIYPDDYCQCNRNSL
jgi:hypothetical protein